MNEDFASHDAVPGRVFRASCAPFTLISAPESGHIKTCWLSCWVREFHQWGRGLALFTQLESYPGGVPKPKIWLQAM